MHPNPVTSSRGRRKAAAKPAAAGVRIRAADADALGAFDLPAARCDASTDPRPTAGSIDPIIVYLL